MSSTAPTSRRRGMALLIVAASIFAALLVATTPSERSYPEHNADPAVIGPQTAANR